MVDAVADSEEALPVANAAVSAAGAVVQVEVQAEDPK